MICAALRFLRLSASENGHRAILASAAGSIEAAGRLATIGEEEKK